MTSWTSSAPAHLTAERGIRLNEDSTGRWQGGMSIAGAAIIPAGLILSGIFAGWKGLAGSFVGFAVASLNTAVVHLRSSSGLMDEAPRLVPTVTDVTMWARLLVLAAVLFGPDLRSCASTRSPCCSELSSRSSSRTPPWRSSTLTGFRVRPEARGRDSPGPDRLRRSSIRVAPRASGHLSQARIRQRAGKT